MLFTWQHIKKPEFIGQELAVLSLLGAKTNSFQLHFKPFKLSTDLHRDVLIFMKNLGQRKSPDNRGSTVSRFRCFCIQNSDILVLVFVSPYRSFVSIFHFGKNCFFFYRCFDIDAFSFDAYIFYYCYHVGVIIRLIKLCVHAFSTLYIVFSHCLIS